MQVVIGLLTYSVSVHVYVSRFFIVFLFFSVLCVFMCVLFFYGSPWSDSNKERKNKKENF